MRRVSSITLVLGSVALLLLPSVSVHAQDSAPRKIKDGEAAVITTAMPDADATAKVKAYLNAKNIDFTVNQETGRVISDWFDERGCGIGFNKCANRANVRVSSEGGQSVINVQVFERKREAGINPKPWNESSKSKGKATAEFADALEAYLKK